MSAAAAARWREAATVFGFLRYPRMLMRGNKLPHVVLGDVGGCEKNGAESYSGVVVGLVLVLLLVHAGIWSRSWPRLQPPGRVV